MMTLNKDKISLIAAKQGLKTKDLCEKIGISRNRFYTATNSKHVTPHTAVRFAAALGVDVLDIIDTPSEDGK